MIVRQFKPILSKSNLQGKAMKGLFTLLLLVSFSAAPFNLRNVPAQKLSTVPVDLEIPFAPMPVKANGKMHLLYELHVTNFSARNLEITRLEVLNDSSNSILARYDDVELIGRLGRPGAPSNLPDKRVIGGGMRAVVFLEIVFAQPGDVPSALRHRLWFKATDSKTLDEPVIGGRVIVRQTRTPVVQSPLRGEGWVALSGMSNTSGHRRTIVVVNGKARIAQRFATDWVRIGSDGLAFRGDPAKNTSWSAYGAEVRASTNGIVVDVIDGIPENDPTSEKKAVPITVASAPGNYIIVNMGNGYFSFYAHLQTNSIRVKVGDHVKVGQVLALLGNSGNSDSPHLHFHICDGNSPLGAEGMAYVLDFFEMQGVLPSKKLLVAGGWRRQAGSAVDNRRREIPIENAIVRFP
jgi:murein DD-endopeptidase MepM/ murein hydrolase activator NlpD